jgi:putative hydrolase of HD superfamily
MTPSLRQALRRRDLGVGAAARSPLPVVVDEPESTSGESRGTPQPTPKLAVSAPRDAAASVQRGFEPDKKTSEAPPAATTARTAASAAAAAALLPAAPASAPASGSGTSTPLGGRRSPRPPYVAPPPPPSASTVLVADPKQRPAPLALFAGPPDDGKEYEEDEEEELSWEKVLHFQHRLERLKINRRTGWLHHRVRDPEW